MPRQQWLDPAWNFEMRVHRELRARPASTTSPTDATLRLLMSFLHEADGAQIDVFGARVEREVDSADWLELAPLLEDKEIDERAIVQQRGRQADFSLSWGEAASAQRGRFFATKGGPRMFVVACSAPKDRWTAHAEHFATSIATFAPLHDRDQRYAEPMRFFEAALVCGDTPHRFTIALPQSWIVEPGSRSETAAALQAENLRKRPYGPDELVGKLAFAVLARSVATTAREVASLYLEAVEHNGLDVGAESVETEPARQPWTASWKLVAPVMRDDIPGELRCRVVCDERVWVLCGVLSPRLEHDEQAWLENKRAWDLAISSMRLTS